MPYSETLNVFKFNHRTLNRNIEGITHEDSVISPVNGAACINWVIGHIVLCRDEIHQLIGLPGFCDKSYNDQYDQGTDGNHPDNPIPLNDMLKLYEDSQMILNNEIEKLDLSDDLKKLERLTFYAFHEGYHMGQIGILRRIIGKEGAIK